ncbi:Fic family protein [Helicobacter bizzozeronii]|uniref:Fic family protein n=1 Tax=Helicobacter bizzozeronii (strain CIII-1) TaxID=1002804 RepID=F8KUF6_HELBC|nr:Fic family protein [Helicobacter bizzozeronii]CCB80891.1 Fic family protein [Helicobacter bizzozeronii CIII-1]
MEHRLSDLSLLEREQLFRTLRIVLTHHSNAIEGLSLQLEETRVLLEKGLTASNKPLHEQLIVLGFASAYDVVVREASDRNKLLDTSLIKDLHYLLFKPALDVSPTLVAKPIGAYRTSEVMITGANFSPTIPALISQALKNLLFRLPSNHLTLAQIALFHAEYERIHPFIDGNGRTGRLIMAFQAIQNDLVPPLILDQQRTEYFALLEQCQTGSNCNHFAMFLKQCQCQSLELIE